MTIADVERLIEKVEGNIHGSDGRVFLELNRAERDLLAIALWQCRYSLREEESNELL